MAHSRVVALFAAVACAMLPVRAAAQGGGVRTYQSTNFAGGGLQLAGTVPIRVPPIRVPWSPRDRALAVGFVTTLLIDAAQTRRLARGGWRDFEETNLILGKHPSEGRVNTYTVVTGLAVLGVAAAAPKRVRPWVLGAALAVEVYALSAMSAQGVAIRF